VQGILSPHNRLKECTISSPPRVESP
jgi:hypothetical protein